MSLVTLLPMVRLITLRLKGDSLMSLSDYMGDNASSGNPNNKNNNNKNNKKPTPTSTPIQSNTTKKTQQQSQQNVQNNKYTMIGVVAGAIVFALIFSFIIMSFLTSNKKATITPENSVVSYVPAEGVEPVEVDVKQLMTDIDELKKQVENSGTGGSGSGGTSESNMYLPEGVSSIAEFNRDEADFLKPSSLRKVQEPIPYKKGYKQVADNQYAFFLTVDYGGATMSIPVHYSDFKLLKPEGVTYFIVEYAEVRPDPEQGYKGIVTGITLDPYWKENLEPTKRAD